MSRSTILWKPVLALGGVQASITLTWVIYNLYLPSLLGQFGFGAGAIFWVIFVEAALAIAMEPLMGSFSDRLQRTLTTQFPFIFAGIVLSSGLFIAIPALVVAGPTNGLARALLPLLMVAWALAMSCFRSPALSLLGRYAIQTQWAPAAAVLTMLGSLASSIGVFTRGYLLSLGPAITFGVGSLVMLSAASCLRAVSPNQAVPEWQKKSVSQNNLSLPALAIVFATGVGIALGFQLALGTFADVLNTRMPSSAAGIILAGVFVLQAFAAIPAGRLASNVGIQRAMLAALVVLVAINLCIGINLSILWLPDRVFSPVLMVLWGTVASVVATSSVPFALSLVPPQKAGLGTGMYFSGGAAAVSLLTIVEQAVDWSSIMSLGIGASAFGVAAACIQMSKSVKQSAEAS
ncbi:MAG: MFS transporter [Cyanobacteria bacterium P01_E01_bin.34]